MDQETVVIEKIVCYSQFPGGGSMPYHGELHKKMRLVTDRERRQLWPRAFTAVSTERSGQGRVSKCRTG